jgi:hypothetical protein
MPEIRSKVIRVRNPLTGEWNDLPAVVSLEALRAADRALASELAAAQSAAEALQTVDNADFIAFDIENENGQLWIYRTDTDSPVTFVLNEETGELEVHFDAE